MANDLRFISTLDHSQFDKGVADSTAEIRKIAEETNQASKGIKGMFDSPEMKEARANFAGVEQSVSKFVQAMSRELPMKKELRTTQVAASELERTWRSLSEEQKNSAAGKALRANIDELIKRGGALRDVMTDVNSAMRFEASDTAKLDAIIGGVQTLTAVAQAAAGALTLMGLSQEDAAKVQKDLIAIMSVVNALQVIQNALQKESALMMGIAAVKAQLLNKALLSNPLFKIVAIGGAVIAFVSKLISVSNKASEAAKEHAKAEAARRKEITDMGKAVADSVGKQVGQFRMLTLEWRSLSTTAEKTKWIEDNQKAFDALGLSIGSVKAAEDVFVNNTDNFVKAMILRGKAMALQQKIEEEAVGWLQKREAARAMFTSTPNYKAGDVIKDVRGLREGIDYKNEGYSYTKRGSGVNWADTQEVKVDKYVLTAVGANTLAQKQTANQTKMLNATLQGVDRQYEQRTTGYVNALMGVQTEMAGVTKGISGYFKDTGGSGKTGKTTTPKATTKKEEEPTTPLSYDWYSERIKQLEDLANKTADVAERAKLLNSAELWAWVRDVKFGEATEEVEGFGKAIQGVAIDIQSAVEGIDFKGIHERIMAPINAAKDAIDGLKEKVATSQEGIRAMGNLMSGMGKIVGGSAGDWLSWSATLMQAVAQALPEIEKLFPALFSKAAAEAMAENSSMGPFGWIAGIAAMASIIASMAMLPKFAPGGIVGGASYGGDRQ
ncbi:MAG: hypothetical protein IIY94_02820, partial [Oscillospiraceae bacterium]|nr:hypothetical protein [Oscillospiraceae bacterium]